MPTKPPKPTATPPDDGLSPTARRQRAWRAKQEIAGLSEVRSVYAPTALHERIRAEIAKWLKLGFPPIK